MKQYPPRVSQTDTRPVALLILTVVMVFFLVLSMADRGPGGVDPFDRPLEAPAGLDL